MKKVIELITIIVSMLEDITTCLRSIKPSSENVFISDAQNKPNIVPDKRFGNSPKDRLIQRITNTLAEIVTRKVLSEALGEYLAVGSLANLAAQEQLNTLVPVRLKNSKKVAYTKESVVLWLYENVEVLDEADCTSIESMICKKAS